MCMWLFVRIYCVCLCVCIVYVCVTFMYALFWDFMKFSKPRAHQRQVQTLIDFIINKQHFSKTKSQSHPRLDLYKQQNINITSDEVCANIICNIANSIQNQQFNQILNTPNYWKINNNDNNNIILIKTINNTSTIMFLKTSFVAFTKASQRKILM